MRRTPLLLAVALAAGAVGAAGLASASVTQKPKAGELTLLALGNQGNGQVLYNIDSYRPAVARSTVPITGLVPGDRLVSIDVRPATGELIGLAVQNTVLRTYSIDHVTGRAGVKAVLDKKAEPDTTYSIDVNPTTNVPATNPVPLGGLRIVSSGGQNLRVPNIDSGVTVVDGRLTSATPGVPSVQGIGYSNSERTPDPSTGTVLFDIDTTTDTLDMQVPANSGALTTIGRLDVGFDVSSAAFDVYPAYSGNRTRTNLGVAVLTGAGQSVLARVDLTSGLARSQGPIVPGVVDIALFYPNRYEP